MLSEAVLTDDDRRLGLAGLACHVRWVERRPVERADQTSVAESANLYLALCALELAEVVEAGCRGRAGEKESLEKHS